jgi:hypothetical protein
LASSRVATHISKLPADGKFMVLQSFAVDHSKLITWIDVEAVSALRNWLHEA